MKKTTKLHFLLFLFLGFTASLTSCKNDDPEPEYNAPTIDLTEVGHDNSKAVTAGSDLHLEAQLTAEALIQKVDIEIHQEEGDFEIHKSYTEGKYIGVKSVEFHEHIDIPEDAPAGDYHLHFTVYDQQGQSTIAESELTINSRGPVIKNLKYGSKDVRDDMIASVGFGPYEGKLYVGADIESETEIKSLVLKIEPKDAGGYVFDEIDITNDFDKSTGKLGTSVSIPSALQAYAGSYSLKLSATDEKNETSEISGDLEVSIKPFIEDFELGSGHGTGERTDHIAYIGRDVHIQGTVYCLFYRLKSIYIEITQDVATNPYKLTALYDESTNYFGAVGGSRNDSFHQHVDIPADAPAGNYKFVFTVTDRENGQYKRELNLELKHP